jgi:hypothetical protein
MITKGIYDGFAEQFGSFTYTTYISGEHNFRDKIWLTKRYKGNRTAERPKHLRAVSDNLLSSYNGVLATGEADDAIVQEHYKYAPNHRTIIVSNDKDLDQAAGWHYDWVKKELYFVSQKDADIFLFSQIISGDATDNVPGLPGFGPAKSRGILEGVESTKACWERVRQVFRDEGFGPEYLEEQSELIYIRRDGRTFKEYFNVDF